MARYRESDVAAGSLEDSPIDLLHRACQCAGDIFQRGIDERELTPSQYAILLTVSQNERLSQTHLVEKTGIDCSTLARAYSVKLTEEGRRVLEAADPLAKRVDERVLAVLPSPQRERFVQDLSALVVALGKMEAAELPAKD